MHIFILPWYERAHLSSNWLQVRLQLGLFQVCICFSRWNPSEEVPTTSENFLPFKITGLLFKAIRLNCREWGAGETHYTSTRLHRLGGGDVKEENSLSCHSHRIQIWVHSTRYYDGLMRNARQTSQLANKARFARVRAARGWTALSHRSCIDPTYQSHTLDPPPEPPRG